MNETSYEEILEFENQTSNIKHGWLVRVDFDDLVELEPCQYLIHAARQESHASAVDRKYDVIGWQRRPAATIGFE